MNSLAQTIVVVVALVTLIGCADPTQQAIDDSYHHGQITSDHRAALTNDLRQQHIAQVETSMKLEQQQPTMNGNYKKTVFPQPLEPTGYDTRTGLPNE